MSVKIERKIIAGWEDITDMLESGRLSYQRAFSTFCGSEAVLDIHESDEATAFAKYAKKSVIRISQTERAEKNFLDSDVLLYGTIERHSWNEDTKSVRVTVKDLLYTKVERKIDGFLFVGKTVTEIMTIIAAELDVNVVYTPNASGSWVNPLVPYYYIQNDVTYKEILSHIAESIGGRIYCSPGLSTATMVVEAGCLVADTSVYDPTPYLSLTADEAVNITFEYPPREHNAWTVKCFSKTVKTDTLYLATIDNEFVIPSSGVGTGDDLHYIEFDMPVLKIIANNIDFTGCPDVAFDSAVYNSNFVDDNPAGYLKNPLRMQIRFTNTSGFERSLLYWNMKIQGVDEQNVEVSIDDSLVDGYKNEYTLQSDIIVEDSSWNTRRLNWEKAFPQEELQFTIVDPAKIPLIGAWDGTYSDPDYTIDYDGAKIVPERLGYSIDKRTWEIGGRADRAAFDSSVVDSTTTHGGSVPAAPEITIAETPDVPTLSSEVRADNKVYLLVTVAEIGSYEVDIYNSTLESQAGIIRAEGGTSPFIVAFRANESESYKVRARISTATAVSEWSEWSTNHTTCSAETPNTPTLAALEKTYTYISIVSAIWTHTKKQNHSHYEVEYYEGTGDQKKLVGIYSTIQQTFALQVSENVLVSVRVRAVDTGGKVSNWSNEEATTSLYDTTLPATPTSLQATEGADLLLVTWVANYEPRRIYFELQRKEVGGSFATIAIPHDNWYHDKTAVAGTYYIYQVRAAKENAVYSSWSSPSVQKTPWSISGALDDLGEDISTLDGKISDLEEIKEDLPSGTEPTVIGDNQITTGMLRAGIVETAKMNVLEIVGNEAWFGKVTADHVGTNEIVANTANIKDAVITNAKISSVDAAKITTGYLNAARIEAGTIHASKLAILSETDDKIELENNVEIGASVGPAGIGGIYVYDASESGQGYILNSNGLYYTNGLESASMLMSLMRQELLFNSIVSLTDGIVVPLPFAIKPERLAINATFKAFQGGGTATQKRYIQTVPILDVSGKVEAIRVLAYQMEATNTLIPTKYKSSGALFAVFPGVANSVSLLKLYANLDWMWVNWGSTVYETQMISFVLPNHAYSGTVSGNRTAYLNVNSFTRTKSGLYYKSYKFNYSITWGDTTSATYDSPWFTVPSKWASEWRNDYPSLVSYDSQSYYTIDATKSAIEAIVELNVHLLGGG